MCYVLCVVCCVLCVVCCVLCVVCCVLCVVCYVLCVMCYVLCVMCYVLCVHVRVCGSSHLLPLLLTCRTRLLSIELTYPSSTYVTTGHIIQIPQTFCCLYNWCFCLYNLSDRLSSGSYTIDQTVALNSCFLHQLLFIHCPLTNLPSRMSNDSNSWSCLLLNASVPTIYCVS